MIQHTLRRTSFHGVPGTTNATVATLGSVLPQDWIEHRRTDREPIGSICPDGDGFRVFDLLGRERTSDPVDWLDAEEMLDELGIGYLADRWVLRLDDGRERPVRVAETSPRGIVVLADEYGAASAVGANPDRYDLPFPATDALRPE